VPSVFQSRQIVQAQVRIVCLDGRIREIEHAGVAGINALLGLSASPVADWSSR
jgi:hypothetical protein